jgi:hypothetical protein
MRLVLAVAMLASLVCASPRAGAAPLLPGCAAPAYHRLDFWLGTWNVLDAEGHFAGTNVIAPILGGCAVEEQWLDAAGHQGRSLFYVDRASGLWKQVWATDGGPIKDKLEQPGAVAGSVRFAGTVWSPNGPVLDRTTLTPLDGGKVRQRIEQSGDQGRSWHAWEGTYVRMPRACDSREHHGFDFWLGDWSVVVRSRASVDATAWQETRGSNHVAAVLNGCAVEERFTAEDGKLGSWSGHSVSTWVPAAKKWRQTWVDDQGNYLAFAGGPEGAEMVLVGEPRPGGKVMRMVFAGIAKDKIDWRWEASSDGGKSWKAVMTIAYRRLGATE